MANKFKIINDIFKIVFMTASILWMEFVLRLYCFDGTLNGGFAYVALFTLPIASLLTFVSSLFTCKINRAIYAVILLLHSCWYVVQCVYYTVFKAFFLLDKLDMADDVLNSYSAEAFDGFVTALPILIVLLLPILLLLALNIIESKKSKIRWYAPINIKSMAVYVAFFAVTQFVAVTVTINSTDGILSPAAVYTKAWTPELSMRNFGALTTLRLNLKQLLFDDAAVEVADVQPESVPEPIQPVTDTQDEIIEEQTIYEPNIMSIDFDELIAEETDAEIIDMHSYYSTREATMQNEYTGMFEGKNLIFITAEGFWQYAVNEQYTPTLYRLANEGFVFENFYNPLWWSSTTDGEFVATNGLYPLNYTWAFYETHDNLMPFTMGNMLAAQGYPTTAYHNNTFTYYERQLTHPNMGYDYYGVGNGLEVTPTWPQSDLEMMELTIPQALDGATPFHLYYMTISGHLYYTFEGNSMASKNSEAVEDLDMSQGAKAYIACQIELDKALEYIIAELDEAGELENTVICLSSDHYPYGLSEEETAEFHGSVPDEFELHRSSLIIWSGDMQQPIYVDKVASSVDILPTLLNLFGLEYDSRLLSGKDILSDSPGVVLFSNQSFITDEGRYSSLTDEWTPNEGSEATTDYAAEIFSDLQQLLSYNENVIIKDYYRSVFE